MYIKVELQEMKLEMKKQNEKLDAILEAIKPATATEAKAVKEEKKK